MEDPHRAPKDRDRSALIARIEKAATEGRIGAADRDIRVGNVRSAQSMAELDLIGRDLDLLEQTLAPGTAPPVVFPEPSTTAGPGPDPAPGPATGIGTVGWEASTGAVVVEGVKGGARGVAIAVVLLLVLGVVGAAVFAVVAFRGGDDTSSGELFDPLPSVSVDPIDPEDSVDPSAPEDPADTEPADSGEPAEPYALRGPAVRAFLAAYRSKFGTTRAIGMTLYDDYAIVRVPVPGKNRNTGWLYRPGQGWQDFGGITANFPGSAVVDTSKLDVPALMRNIETARRTLNVEEYSLTYVNIDYRPDFDDAPNVNIYVSNEFHESGYLATSLDGRVERAYPYSG